jgi:hypothetical protein
MLLAVEIAAVSAVVQMQMLAWVAGAATMHVICSRHGLCFSLEYNCKLQLLQLLTLMINLTLLCCKGSLHTCTADKLGPAAIRCVASMIATAVAPTVQQLQGLRVLSAYESLPNTLATLVSTVH